MCAHQDTRTLFLEEFVKRLIINSVDNWPKIKKTDNLFEKLEKKAISPPIIKIEKKVEEIPVRKPEIRKIETKPPIIIQRPPMIIQRPQVMQKLPEQHTGLPIMDRLSPILADPTVQSINCPGPNKNITVLRNGAIQPVAMSFTSEEISTFLKDISEKTRIPLLPGLFKVVYRNLIITAAISEFVDTKFMIEKRIIQNLPPLPIKTQFK